MATTTDLTVSDGTTLPGNVQSGSIKLTKVLDCAVDKFAAADDIHQVIAIPAHTTVERVGARVTKVEGEASTFDVGDGADVDGYLDGVDANALGSKSSVPVLEEGTPNVLNPKYGLGKHYTAADTIDVKSLTVGLDKAVIEIYAFVRNIGAI
jgi:hypothetical protein